MKSRFIHTPWVAGLFSVFSIGQALAQEAPQRLGFYAELGYTNIGHAYVSSTSSSSSSSDEPTYNLNAIRAIAGYDITPNFAVEGMLASGMRSDTQWRGTEKLSSMAGLYAKGKINFTPNLNLYGRVGVVQTAIRFNSTSTKSLSSPSLGGGVSYTFPFGLYLNTDMTMYYAKSNNSVIMGVTVSAGYRF